MWQKRSMNKSHCNRLGRKPHECLSKMIANLMPLICLITFMVYRCLVFFLAALNRNVFKTRTFHFRNVWFMNQLNTITSIKQIQLKLYNSTQCALALSAIFAPQLLIWNCADMPFLKNKMYKYSAFE